MDGKSSERLRDQIFELVSAAAGPNLREQLSEHTDILTSKLVDSFSLLQLIVEIEQNYNINILTEDMTLENFSTVSAIVDLIIRYQNDSRANDEHTSN